MRDRQSLKVGVVGLGYVGLTTAIGFASKGIPTVGVDIDLRKLRTIRRGEVPFFERGLEDLLKKSLRSGRLVATSDYDALREADIIFIAVNTPGSRNGSADLSSVRSAAESIGRAIRGPAGYKVVVVKSTVPPMTTEGLVGPAIQKESSMKKGQFGLVANPEFLREDHALEDTMKPDRLVIGTSDAASRRAVVALYKRFYRKMPKMVLTTPTNAELIKYASNAFLATKVSFINEIARLASKLPGADVKIVARGMGFDKRIGSGSLRAGLGYGGSCLPKDVSAILKMAEREGVKLGIAGAAAEVNKKQPLVAVKLAKSLLGDLREKRIALLGLAFKPESDDTRGAVSVRLAKELVRRKARVVAYDPVATPNARRVLGSEIAYAASARDCIAGADCCILVTEWDEFRKLQPEFFKRLMRTPAVVDGRRALNPMLFPKSGVKFSAVGLGLQPA